MYNDYTIYKGKAFASDEEIGLQEVPIENTEEFLKLSNDLETLFNERRIKTREYEECRDKTTPKKFLLTILKYLGYAGLIISGTEFLFGDFFMIDPVVDPKTMCLVTRGIFGGVILIKSSIDGFKAFLKNTQNRDGLVQVIKFLDEEIANTMRKIANLREKKVDFTPDTKIVSLKEYNEQYRKDTRQRMKRIQRLGALRDELIECLDKGTLEDELKSRGFFREDLARGKRYVMEMKNTQKND